MADPALQQLKRGTLEMIFLSLFSAKPRYGGKAMAVLNAEGARPFPAHGQGPPILCCTGWRRTPVISAPLPFPGWI